MISSRVISSLLRVFGLLELFHSRVVEGAIDWILCFQHRSASFFQPLTRRVVAVLLVTRSICTAIPAEDRPCNFRHRESGCPFSVVMIDNSMLHYQGGMYAAGGFS
ncbi:hypothetical protein GOP47_0029653 [Adiantum capillus-veneris]|nr:hypothetical protein GOP47_0029653 [Adiantum capillus-veneris]